jgi:predicted amidohydrolase YtcJ
VQIRDLAPDLILTNGRIHTLDPHNTVAQAVAVKDGRFLTLGSSNEIEAIAAAQTKRIDLNGRLAIPGLFDSHAHLQEVGLKLAALRLDECQSPEEMMELVRQRAAATEPGTWIVGMGWNEGNFKDGRLPTRHDIDPATSNHPVILMRFFNADVVNSVALKLAGITKATADPLSGKIERDADGTANGLLRASAKQLVRDHLPPHTLADLKHALALGCEDFNQYGITSVLDPGLMTHEMHAYQSFYQDGKLTVRMNLMPSWHGFRDEETETQLNYRARELGIFSGLGDEWLRIGGLKMAIDGGTTSHTAYMYEPFEGETEVKNYNRLNTADLRRYFQIAQEHGWDVGIHVCGDRALDMAVDALAETAVHYPRPNMRHNVIHAYFPSDRAIEQMAEHRIAAVFQPTFLYWEGDLPFRDVGHQRALNYKPARKLLDAGVIVTASSDVPSTVSANPFIALYALVTRKNNLGHHIAADQAISRLEALHAYTTAGTWLTREEHLKGTIEPGKLADLAVLDRDYFAIPDEELKEIQAVMTVVGGEVVFERETGD